MRECAAYCLCLAAAPFVGAPFMLARARGRAHRTRSHGVGKMVLTLFAPIDCAKSILFIHKCIVFHLIDRCTRWHAAKTIDGKTKEHCVPANDELWISTHGAPKELVDDGESGMARSDTFNRYLARKGIRPHARGKDQHARFVERRGALLRDSVQPLQRGLRACS